MNQVIRAFATSTRRFRVGDCVTESDISGPMSLDDWVRAGFVVAAGPAVVTPTPDIGDE
ncbi:MAG: hypothetical protein ABMA15_18430 [Vicinamibacterales bacterium]